MKKIKLSKGYYVQVDDSDYEFLNQWNWHVYENPKSNVKYAYRNIPNGTGGQTTVQMHRVLLELTDSKIMADHIDGDGLNNQRINLRTANHSQNANRKPFGKSKYRGVSLIVTKYGKYWYAKCSKGKILKSKICENETDAALTYNEFATSIHGQYARLNIVN